MKVARIRFLGALGALLTLRVIANGATIDFQTPSLGASPSKIINPFVDAASGISFTAEDTSPFVDVVGLTTNSHASACTPPPSSNQLLGSGNLEGGDDSVGRAGQPIRATFPHVIGAGSKVRVRFQDSAGTQDHLTLYDQNDNPYPATTVAANPPLGWCPWDGPPPRASVFVEAIAPGDVAYAVMRSGLNHSFSIDDFTLEECDATIVTPDPTPMVAQIDPQNDGIFNDCGETSASPIVRVAFYHPGAATDAAGIGFRTTAQTKSREIILTATLDTATANIPVYFRVADPDDALTYDPPAANDNLDPIGSGSELDRPALLPWASCRIDNGSDLNLIAVKTNAQGVVRILLRVTDEWAGDDYLVRVKVGSAPTDPLTVNPPSSGERDFPRFVAWARILVEADRMYDKSYDLAAPVAPGSQEVYLQPLTSFSPPPPVAMVDTVRIFDAKPYSGGCTPTGEIRLVTAVDLQPDLTIRLTLDAALACDYQPGYPFLGGPPDPTKRGGAVAVTASSGGGGSARVGSPVDLDTSHLGAAFADIRHEFVVVSAGLPVPNRALCAQCSPDSEEPLYAGRFAKLWFATASDDRYLYLLGGDRNIGDTKPCCMSTPECSPNRVEGVASDPEQWVVTFCPRTSSCPAVHNREMVAHEVGHQFDLPDEPEESTPPPATTPCVGPPLSGPICMMNRCMDPDDGVSNTRLEQDYVHSHLGFPLLLRKRANKL